MVLQREFVSLQWLDVLGRLGSRAKSFTLNPKPYTLNPNPNNEARCAHALAFSRMVSLY